MLEVPDSYWYRFLMTSYLISTLNTAEVSGETLILHQRKKCLFAREKVRQNSLSCCMRSGEAWRTTSIKYSKGQNYSCYNNSSKCVLKRISFTLTLTIRNISWNQLAIYNMYTAMEFQSRWIHGNFDTCLKSRKKLTFSKIPWKQLFQR